MSLAFLIDWIVVRNIAHTMIEAIFRNKKWMPKPYKKEKSRTIGNHKMIKNAN